ncbi:MAG: indole-3-glycerol phosphate synthase TrpC [Cytophagales bacterium]|nr:MAG: indole-3-glycerol phosphate synthase TrpC [Cytophagales bacterium]
MNILDTIIQSKYKEVAQRKEQFPIKKLEKHEFFERKTNSLKRNLQQSATGIIAEFKRKSPSKGIINDRVGVEEVTQGYAKAGASGISILTDTDFFGGTTEDLLKARPHLTVPILRKDFIIDEYQIIEAKAMGADVVLLIAAVLSPKQINELAEFAHSLGLEVLMEVHDLEELQRSLNYHLDIVGVNNRNLKNFEVSINISKDLTEHIPKEFVKISESGISEVKSIKILQEYGYQGFLIGENFMKSDNPAEMCHEFMESMKES